MKKGIPKRKMPFSFMWKSVQMTAIIFYFIGTLRKELKTMIA